MVGYNRKAPKGKYRVLGVDTFDGDESILGDFDTKEEAIKLADEKGGNMFMAYVYDDEGTYLHQAGTF